MTYTKVSEKFYRIMRNGTVLEIENAKPFRIPAFPSLDLCIGKTEEGWAVTEGRSGQIVGKCARKLRRMAIEEAQIGLERFGLERVEECIASSIARYGLTPRYRE